MTAMSDGPMAHLSSNYDKGRAETGMECMRYVGSTVSSDDKSEALRVTLHPSRQTLCTWVRDLGLEDERGKQGYAPKGDRKARARGNLVDVVRGCAKKGKKARYRSS